MDRNPISDLEAVAAMPGLEALASVLARNVRKASGSAADPASILIFLAARWAFGSANRADSAFRTTPLWDVVRQSASSVGRELPSRAPTMSMLDHLRRAALPTLFDELSEAFTLEAVALAREVGLLAPDPCFRWDEPSPSTTIYGDGSIVGSLSEVSVDDEGTVHGSRAKVRPRIAPRYQGKHGGGGATGLPIAVVGCHGRQRWQRVILGVGLFFDRNEIGAAMTLLERVIDVAEGGVTHVVYDRLMSGTHLRQLMTRRVIPVVAMPEAPSNAAHLVLPAELQRTGYRSAGSREKRKGKGARRRPADKVAPKARLATHHIRLVEHDTWAGPCSHEIWAIDGALVTVAPGETVSLDSPYVGAEDLFWREESGGSHPIGVHRVPCRRGSFTIEVDYAGDRRGPRGTKALADHVRPIPEVLAAQNRIEGLRSDVESAFSWLKSLLPRNRAGSLKEDHFALDLIGAGLLVNAIAWDVHASRHTRCAQDEARRRQKGLHRAK